MKIKIAEMTKTGACSHDCNLWGIGGCNIELDKNIRSKTIPGPDCPGPGDYNMNRVGTAVITVITCPTIERLEAKIKRQREELTRLKHVRYEDR